MDNFPEWHLDNIRAARDFLDRERDYIALPTKYDLDEYRLMEKFSLSLANRKTSEILYASLQGRGAFRRFRNALRRLNLTDQWYAYKEDAVRQIAIDWCERNRISFKEG